MENFDKYFLGKLDSNVFENSRGVLQFSVKSILDDKEYHGEGNKFTCFIDSIYKYGLIEGENESKEERFYDFLNERLVIFNKTVNGFNQLTHNEIFVKRPVNFNGDFLYKAIPVFSKKTLKITFDEFKEKLLNREWIEKVKGISENIEDVPNIIFFEDEEKIYAITGLRKQFCQYGKVRYDYEKIYFVEENEEWYENFVRSAELESIIFVEENTALEIEKLARGNDFIEDLETLKESVKEDRESVKEEVFKENIHKKLNEEIKGEFLEERDEEASINESVFLNTFMNTCKSMHLLYEEEDLINFHTAMKSSKLVILSGMSGTGKSKIVQAYGKALGMGTDRLNFISVRPSWGDDSDLLGYVDSINHVYRPGDSGFIDTLIEAENNGDELYIICLDEMNLARVEHYFSQILSVLEFDPEERILKLYNEELESSIKNSSRYKSSIGIGENILIVGTVNLDESTYHFSDKVLDRANVMTLKQASFLELKKIKNTSFTKDAEKKISFKEYEEMINKNENIDLSNRELEFLSEISNEMNFLNKNVGIGFRIVTQINDYIRNIPKNSLISRKEGIDIQLSQRILPKIRGTKEQWGEFIGEYNLYDEDGIYSKDLNSKLINILDNYSDVSDFKTSKKHILNKARELSIYGYTL